MRYFILKDILKDIIVKLVWSFSISIWHKSHNSSMYKPMSNELRTTTFKSPFFPRKTSKNHINNSYINIQGPLLINIPYDVPDYSMLQFVSPHKE